MGFNEFKKLAQDIQKNIDLQKNMVPPAVLSVKSLIPELKMPDIPPSPLIQNMEGNQASEFYKRLTEWIINFDRELDHSHEVGVRLVSFGQTVVFHLEDMGYWNPSLISFKGKKEDGQLVELIKHVSQISILLTSLPRKNPDEPKKPIGFRIQEA